MNEPPQNQSRNIEQLLRTRKLVHQDLQEDGPFAPPRQTGPLDAGLGPPWVVELRIHDTPITIRLEVEKELSIGRSDVGTETYPDLDMTPYGGLDKGVSRQHAALLADARQLMLVDHNSTNGTFVNGLRLRPDLPFRLRHGDTIHLGQLRIEVHLQVTPVHERAFMGQPWVRLHREPGAGNGQRVLMIENNEDVSATLKTILSRAGYTVQIVPDMGGAFYAVTQRVPDVIVVLNLGFSDANGLALCNTIRRVTQDAAVPMIVVSEDDNTHIVQDVMEAGIDVFLGKPVGVNELVRVINSMTQMQPR